MKRTIEISEETYEKLKDQLKEEDVQIEEFDDFIGKKFFFRTVTYHITGRVVARIGNILKLKQAAWIAESGRFADTIKSGTLNEVEPLGDWFVNLDTITDFGVWRHELPTVQK